VSLSKLLSAFAVTSLLATVVVGCAAETEDEEALGESEDRLLAGRRLPTSEIAGHLRAAGFPESEIGRMVCTAKYESSYYARASNRNRNGSYDRGLFQINSIHLGSMRGCPSRGNADALWDPATNTQCAYAIFRAQGNRAWYGYRKHKTECDRFQAPSSSGFTPQPDVDDDNDQPSTTDDDAGGCWSGTLQDMMDARSCVQSRSNRVWFQCLNGTWYRGVSGNNGPHGACTSSHPL
jgi:hypothetical protein